MVALPGHGGTLALRRDLDRGDLGRAPALPRSRLGRAQGDGATGSRSDAERFDDRDPALHRAGDPPVDERRGAHRRGVHEVLRGWARVWGSIHARQECTIKVHHPKRGGSIQDAVPACYLRSVTVSVRRREPSRCEGSTLGRRPGYAPRAWDGALFTCTPLLPGWSPTLR